MNGGGGLGAPHAPLFYYYYYYYYYMADTTCLRCGLRL
jgi:hypothetical protein